MITAEQLAAALHAELKENHWGDIDSFWVQGVAENLDRPDDPDDREDSHGEIVAVRRLLEAVATRLNVNAASD